MSANLADLPNICIVFIFFRPTDVSAAGIQSRRRSFNNLDVPTADLFPLSNQDHRRRKWGMIRRSVQKSSREEKNGMLH
jgi:hypothetical protein